jgi:hypothetical protein
MSSTSAGQFRRMCTCDDVTRKLIIRSAVSAAWTWAAQSALGGGRGATRELTRVDQAPSVIIRRQTVTMTVTSGELLHV